MINYLDISLIITTYNEANNIDKWCQSLLKMKYQPKEIIVVDSLSEDSTIDIIRYELNSSPIDITIINEKCNISKGRNIAISNTSFELIAITDAGVTFDKLWLYKIYNELTVNDVVAGYYKFTGDKWFQKSFRRLYYKEPESVNGNNFLPSSRSLGIKKYCWKAVDGYNENYTIGEDTDFDMKLVNNGFKFVFIKDAIVYWDLRPSLFKLSKQHFLYSYWDAIIGQNNKGNIVFLFYSLFFAFMMISMFIDFSLFLSLLIISNLIFIIHKKNKINIQNFFPSYLVYNLCSISKGIGYFVGIINGFKKNI